MASLVGTLFRGWSSSHNTHSAVKGLEGVLATETAISSIVSPSSSLIYCGYSIEDLAANCKCYEEVAFLLLRGRLPTPAELAAFQLHVARSRELPEGLKDALKLIPKTAHPMDVLRNGTGMLGSMIPENKQHGSNPSTDQQMDAAVRLFACLPMMLLQWYHFHTSAKFEDYSPLMTEIEKQPSFVENFFQMLFRNEPDKLAEVPPEAYQAMNVSLMLYGDHDLNASTFAARVAASTCTDFYSAVTAAICTLKGPLHGGASEAAIDLVLSAQNETEAEEMIKSMLAKKQLVMGFGHRIYKHGDPRSAIIKSWAKKLSELPSTTPAMANVFRVAESIETTMLKEKSMYPNLDFYTAVCYHLCSVPKSFFTPLFAFSRVVGWSAHIFEQRASNRLIRPSACYVGSPPRAFVPIEERGKNSDGAGVDARL